MQELLALFKEGSTYDNALQKVYGFDTDGSEELWRARITAMRAHTGFKLKRPPSVVKSIWCHTVYCINAIPYSLVHLVLFDVG